MNLIKFILLAVILLFLTTSNIALYIREPISPSSSLSLKINSSYSNDNQPFSIPLRELSHLATADAINGIEIKSLHGNSYEINFTTQATKHTIPSIIKLSTDKFEKIPRQFSLDLWPYFYYSTHSNQKFLLKDKDKLNGFDIAIRSIRPPSSYKRPAAQINYGSRQKPIVMLAGSIWLYNTRYKATKIKLNNSLFFEAEGSLKICKDELCKDPIQPFDRAVNNKLYLSNAVPSLQTIKFELKDIDGSVEYSPVLFESATQKEVWLLLKSFHLAGENSYIIFLGTDLDNDNFISNYEPNFLATKGLDFERLNVRAQTHFNGKAIFEIQNSGNKAEKVALKISE